MTFVLYCVYLPKTTIGLSDKHIFLRKQPQVNLHHPTTQGFHDQIQDQLLHP
jgi:hypothetical protein